MLPSASHIREPLSGGPVGFGIPVYVIEGQRRRYYVVDEGRRGHWFALVLRRRKDVARLGYRYRALL